MKSRHFNHTGSLVAPLATFVIVASVSVAALVGHDRAGRAHDTAAAGHHMASLSEIAAFMKKAQDSEH